LNILSFFISFSTFVTSFFFLPLLHFSLPFTSFLSPDSSRRQGGSVGKLHPKGDALPFFLSPHSSLVPILLSVPFGF